MGEWEEKRQAGTGKRYRAGNLKWARPGIWAQFQLWAGWGKFIYILYY